MAKQKFLPGFKSRGLSRSEKEKAFFKDLHSRMTEDEKMELYRSGQEEKQYKSEVRRLARKYGLEVPQRFKEWKPPTKIYVPKELTKYEQDALSAHRLLDRQITESFDMDIKKDVVVFSKRSGPYEEQFKFEKDVVDIDGKRHIPSPKAMKRDGRATFTIVREKGQNPVTFTAKEKMRALGFPEDKIKKATGYHYNIAKIPFIQLASLRYFKWKWIKGKDGKLKKKLLQIANPPYERIWISEKGQEFGALISEHYLKGLDLETGELRPGDFKTTRALNPYRGQPIEERFFEWLEMYVKGRSFSISVDRILNEILKIREKDYHWQKKCRGYLDRCLEVAREAGCHFEIDTKEQPGGQAITHLLKRYTFEEIARRAPDLEIGDCRGWIIKFEYRLTPFPLGPEERLFADEMVRYFYDEQDFDIENPREKTRDYFYLYIRKIGLARVKEIFGEVKNSKVRNKPRFIFKKLKEAGRGG